MKCLLAYPNVGTELRIPLAISIVISALRKAGHEVKLFDTTFIGEFHTDNEAMVKLGTHLPVNLGVTSNSLVIEDEFNKVLESFKPDIIMASVVERNFNTAKRLLKDTDIPVMIGGIMPTIAPDFMINQDWIDFICVGEGEQAVIEFLENWSPNVENIWSRAYSNPLRPLISMDEVPDQDWSDFDDRQLLKPFMGKVYRGGAFEFSRGCFGSCTFCVAPKLRKTQEGLGTYHRTKTPEKLIKEIEDKVKQYNLSMIAFSDTDFLRGVSFDTMAKFLIMYADRINLPFTMQCSANTLFNEYILTLLRKAGCCAISVGVESGSSRIRNDVIKKPMSDDMLVKAFNLCRKYELRVTANYMVGLPTETEDDVRDTMKLNRLINPPSIAVTYFTPFMGTELYDVCVKEGYYKPFQENVYEYPPLEMPQLSQNRIKELVREFSDEFKTYQEDFSVI
jgi:anaerobic magnesium-protoporphyrin IX monomethyl ester cyclase